MHCLSSATTTPTVPTLMKRRWRPLVGRTRRFSVPSPFDPSRPRRRWRESPAAAETPKTRAVTRPRVAHSTRADAGPRAGGARCGSVDAGFRGRAQRARAAGHLPRSLPARAARARGGGAPDRRPGEERAAGARAAARRGLPAPSPREACWPRGSARTRSSRPRSQIERFDARGSESLRPPPDAPRRGPELAVVAWLPLFGAAAGCGSTVDSVGYNNAGRHQASPPGRPAPAIRTRCTTSARATPTSRPRSPPPTASSFTATRRTQAIFFPVGTDQAKIEDTFHDDIRTEGMGLGMLISVELNKQDEFNRLWRYSKTVLEYPPGTRHGYFRSACDTETGSSPCIDPFGMEQFLTALAVRQRSLGERGEHRLRCRRAGPARRHAQQGSSERRGGGRCHQRVRCRRGSSYRRSRHHRGRPDPSLDRDALPLRAVGAGHRRPVLVASGGERACPLEADLPPDDGADAGEGDVRRHAGGRLGDVPTRGLPHAVQSGPRSDLGGRRQLGRCGGQPAAGLLLVGGDRFIRFGVYAGRRRSSTSFTISH